VGENRLERRKIRHIDPADNILALKEFHSVQGRPPGISPQRAERTVEVLP
jgi:hypothetical protein